MKKIVFLSAGIMLLLMASLVDARIQKRKLAEASASGSIQAEAADTEPQSDVQDTIRVLIKTDNFAEEYHSEIAVTSDGAFTVSDGERRYEYDASERLEITAQGDIFAESEVLYLTSEKDGFRLPELVRERSSDLYEGTLEIRRTPKGLLVINELPLERYLCGVVPSEMPSGYPLEALKAQAVCARTYAQRQIGEMRAAEFFADVDDSVSYQVYNNQEHSASTDAAVRTTAGEVLMQGDAFAEALYYSTSCGMDVRTDLSQESVFASFLTDSSVRAYEAEEPWYRWQTDIALENLGGVAELRITQRLPSGCISRMEAVMADGETAVYEGEYRVREFLAGAAPVVTLQDGETLSGMALLPSAFFIMQPQREDGVLTGYHILGGGYGHGIGMSQNGAKHMALEGKGYKEILQTYYDDAQLMTPQ